MPRSLQISIQCESSRYALYQDATRCKSFVGIQMLAQAASMASCIQDCDLYVPCAARRGQLVGGDGTAYLYNAAAGGDAYDMVKEGDAATKKAVANIPTIGFEEYWTQGRTGLHINDSGAAIFMGVWCRVFKGMAGTHRAKHHRGKILHT